MGEVLAGDDVVAAIAKKGLPGLVGASGLAKTGSGASKRSPTLPGGVSAPVVIPPPGKEPIVHWGKEKIRVQVKQGVTIVTVKRAHGLSAAELIALGAGLILAYSFRGVLGSNLSSDLSSVEAHLGVQNQTNILGIPFSLIAPGGAWDPINYIL